MRIAPACAVLGLTALAFAIPAHAGIMNYSDVGNLATDGVSYTNIQESNNVLPVNSPVGLYGQPILSATKGLWFNHPDAFEAQSSNGAAVTTTGFLSFNVNLATPSAASVLLSEYGVFDQLNGTNPTQIGGFGKVVGVLSLLDGGGHLLTTSFLTLTTQNNNPDYVWIGTSAVNDNQVRSSYIVQYDNDLFTTSLPGSVTNLDKKNLTFDIVGVQTQNAPEPASLGLLGLGVVALLKRRK
jgi:hypothetical protein